MGAEQSSDAAADGEAAPVSGAAEDGAPQIDVNTLSGYRCMKVFRGGPAARAGLTTFEDFIVAVDGTLVDGDGSLSHVLASSEGKQLQLSVWNCVDAAERCVTLTPGKWTGGPGILGAAVRYEPIKGALDSCWRVLDVAHRSPADDAGLVPRSDYIVGTPAEVFRSTDAFSKLISKAAKENVSASVMVWSSEMGKARIVEITPHSSWGGDGSLGAELATGLLHRVSRNNT